MSQPALSHQIATIERELGTAVIERLPRGIRPTAAGLAAASADRMLDVLVSGGADVAVTPPPTLTDEHVEVLSSLLSPPRTTPW